MKFVKNLYRAGVAGLAFAAGIAAPALADQNGPPRTINNAAQETVKITAYTDGLRRDKYVVQADGSRNFWYAQNGSANAGAGESGRHTSNNEWCRVRYLYGDNGRIPECWGDYMYSSHLITGLDGTHYELWFSPDSLTYFKIRNQESGLWYAHDGSSNDGKVYTSKEDWCRIIFYHMSGILKRPEECDAVAADIVNAIAGTRGATAQKRELAYVKAMMGEEPRYDPRGQQSELESRSIGAGWTAANMAAEEGFTKLAGGTIENLDYTRTSGFLANKAPPGTPDTIKLKAGNAVAGLVVGVAVDYGIDKIKDAAGLRAQDANAGWIAAEAVSTTVASASISTAIMTACGASFNPVVAGFGVLVAGGITAGQEINKASEDTAIRLEPNYGQHIRYNRDLNGISDLVFAQNNPEGTFFWEPCAEEGQRCEFSGLRSVRYGSTKLSDDGKQMLALQTIDNAFIDGVDCTNAAAGKGNDPHPNVKKKCFVGKLNWDRRESYFVKRNTEPAIWFQIDSNRHCLMSNPHVLAAYGGGGQVRVMNQLNLKGENLGACPFPNGFYRVASAPAIYFLSGEDKTVLGGAERVVGNRVCEVPSMEMLAAMGANTSMVQVVGDGSDLHRMRHNMGGCWDGKWVGTSLDVAGTDVGDRWVITRTPKNGNYTIAKLDEYGAAVALTDGWAVRVGGRYVQPWVVQADGKTYKWNNPRWEHLPGKSAKDVGTGWIISDEPTVGGFKVYYYDFRTKSWVDGGGGALRIGGTYEDPWAVTVDGDVFQRVGGKWQSRPGIKAMDVGQGWAITQNPIGGSYIFKWNDKNQKWDAEPGGPQIAVGGTQDFPTLVSGPGENSRVRNWR